MWFRIHAEQTPDAEKREMQYINTDTNLDFVLYVVPDPKNYNSEDSLRDKQQH